MTGKIKSAVLRIIPGALLLTALFLFKSCELENCMMCKKVTYENGTKISESDPVQYCGLDLDMILDEEDVTIGNRTTRWECN